MHVRQQAQLSTPAGQLLAALVQTWSGPQSDGGSGWSNVWMITKPITPIPLLPNKVLMSVLRGDTVPCCELRFPKPKQALGLGGGSKTPPRRESMQAAWQRWYIRALPACKCYTELSPLAGVVPCHPESGQLPHGMGSAFCGQHWFHYQWYG